MLDSMIDFLQPLQGSILVFAFPGLPKAATLGFGVKPLRGKNQNWSLLKDGNLSLLF
jgi:hypothetical protein